MLASNIQSWAWVVSLNGYGNKTPICEFEKEQKTTLPSTLPTQQFQTVENLSFWLKLQAVLPQQHQ